MQHRTSPSYRSAWTDEGVCPHVIRGAAVPALARMPAAQPTDLRQPLPACEDHKK